MCVCVCVMVPPPSAGSVEDRSVPTLVQGLAGHRIVDVDCGSGDAHTLALEDNGSCW